LGVAINDPINGSLDSDMEAPNGLFMDEEIAIETVSERKFIDGD
jgi:hypothetical protein